MHAHARHHQQKYLSTPTLVPWGFAGRLTFAHVNVVNVSTITYKYYVPQL
jgi:hypothetical protein